MAQYCPTCGTEMVFYHQNQSWYCHRCQRYAGIQQPVQQPGTYQGHYNAYYQPAYQPAYTPQYYQTAYAPQQYQQYPMQYPQPYGTFYPMPPAMPDQGAARSKIYAAMNMRESADKIISTSWAVGILALQVVIPVITLAMIYFLVSSGSSLSGATAIIALVLTFAMAALTVAFQAVLIYKLVKRRDEHFRRDGLLRQGMIEYLDALSLAEGRDINVERWTMNSMHYSAGETDRSPMLWALLVGLGVMVPVLGIIVMLYSLHFLTRDVQAHHRRQRDFNHQFQMGMLKLGRINAINYDWQPLPNRDTASYVILVVLTLGFALPYWWYVNILDMNRHLQGQWNFEGRLMEMTREGEVAHGEPAESGV